ncbi:hypothetical protein HOLleu_29836 [Holothuria leucospilota]|uniref:Uncharacterized protein n=1 Tax=Holothuria leucospilota TaxID=206669 RepID=A0A9Q1BJS9_HOLLE|nr:hypothetical protein HOLleu_29836 [Holothuria leucospilota]
MHGLDHKAEGRQSGEIVAIDAKNKPVAYSAVNKVKTEKTSNETQRTDEIVSTDVVEHIPKYEDVQKAK